MAGRRRFLQILGGGVVLAATAVAGWTATRDPAAARRPWTLAGGDETDPCRRALSFAVLAPNPHNRQPWLADLSVADTIALYCDADRRLPHTDPFDRQITIGLGCFLELLVQAAAEDGQRTEVTLFPEGQPQPRLDTRPVARIRFAPAVVAAPDPLFAQVLERRSNKEPYDTARPVAGSHLAAIAAAAVGDVAHTADPDRVGRLRALAWQAMHTELTTPAAARESVELLRIGRAEIEANPDGIDLSGPIIEALAVAGMMPREAMLDPTSETFRRQIAILKRPFDTAMAFLWLATPGNARTDQIAAGRDWVRINLAAAGRGVAIHPLSQALQEFTEMRPHHEAMRSELQVGSTETLQMFARLGYAPAPQASPRWPYQSRIRSA